MNHWFVSGQPSPICHQGASAGRRPDSRYVFDHFCGGVNENDCLTVVDKMYTKGVSSVLDYSVEGKEEEAQLMPP
jgi:hypothetical protein